MTAQKMAQTIELFGSAPKNRMLMIARPLIVAELSNETINILVALFLILVLQCFDDLIDPSVRIHHCDGKDVSLYAVVLCKYGQHADRTAQQDEPHGLDHQI